MTRDTLTDNFIGAIQAEPSQHPLTFENPYAGGHTLACLATHDSLLSHVVLFGVFYATFITRNPSGYGGDSRVFFINPASRDYKASDFVKEANAGRITSLVKPTSLRDDLNNSSSSVLQALERVSSVLFAAAVLSPLQWDSLQALDTAVLNTAAVALGHLAVS